MRVLIAAAVAAAAGPWVLSGALAGEPQPIVRIAVVTEGPAAPLVGQLMDGEADVEAVYRHAFDGAVVQVAADHADQVRRDPRVLAVDRLGPARELVTGSDAPGSLPDAYGPVAYVLDSPVATDDPWFDGVTMVSGFTAHPVGDDCAGHGSAVAGVVAGRSGLVRGVPVVSVAVSCRRLDDRAVLDALEWVAARHPPGTSGVLNVSLALPGHASFEYALRGVVAQGIVPVFAAGNRGVDACAGLIERVADVALVVGAVDAELRRSRSNLGPCVDVFAVGQGVLTTDGRGGLRLLGGTSSAAPQVTAEVARRLQVGGHQPVEQVIAEVVEGARTAPIHDAGPGSPHRVVQPAPADRHYRDERAAAPV